MRFKDNNDRVYISRTKEDLVVELWLSSFAKAKAENAEDWCRQCEKRIHEVDGTRIIYNDCESFIDELIKYDFIREIN